MLFRSGMRIDRDLIISELIRIQYQRNDYETRRGTFRVRGDTLDIYPTSAESMLIRVTFFGDEIEEIREIDAITGRTLNGRNFVTIFPASHYTTTEIKMQQATVSIQMELEERLAELQAENKLLEAYRLEQRTRYDLEMLAETGFCKIGRASCRERV